MRSTSTVAKAAVLLLASSSWLGADSLSTPALEPTSHSERHRELKTCAEIEREKKCETPGCAWKDEVCVDCTSINKQKDCADPGCMWTGSCEAVPTTERPTRSPVTYCAGFDKEKIVRLIWQTTWEPGWVASGTKTERSAKTRQPRCRRSAEPTRRPTNEPTTQEPTLNTDQPTTYEEAYEASHPEANRSTDERANGQADAVPDQRADGLAYRISDIGSERLSQCLLPADNGANTLYSARSRRDKVRGLDRPHRRSEDVRLRTWVRQHDLGPARHERGRA
ncbi:hypothetical protein THAOC_11467, partial [Thalassiosira oceanica]